METDIKLLSTMGLLADEDKFKVTGAIALGAGTPSDIGKTTGLDSSKIIKTLVRLEKAGLIENRGDNGYYYCAKVLKDLYFGLSQTLEHKPEQSHLDRFIRDGRLLTFPKSRDDRRLVLEHTANMFEFDRRYTETEVNTKLGTLHADYAALRRYLVDYGFLARKSKTKDDHTIMFYWRMARS
jgi:hypothetical protein